MALLEVSGEHIMRLDDKALRELVVRLCEAELRRNGLGLSALRAGGLQDTPDGGVDVCVDLSPAEPGAPGLDFIKRPSTRLQCKASKMEPSEIRKEMMPRGQLRQAIKDLAQTRGSYIIASSKETVSMSMLQNRRAAMSNCLAGVENELLLDFYDSDALARWTSQYPGVSAWVRHRIGQPIGGWRAHGDWAAANDARTSYIADDRPRLDMGRAASGERQRIPVAEGMRTLCSLLRQERQVIRLVGLSGTGKTRLVQALFEPDATPEEPLDPACAIYTDLGEDAQGQLEFVTRLRQESARAIIVLDNCAPGQHQQFAEACKAEGSRLSLLTIEYDVRADDEAPDDNTQVFRLEPGSEDLVDELLRRHPRHGRLPALARREIAKFADGNARLALAMARFAPRSETLADFSEAHLFDRLFHQRGERSDELRRAAEACALVYSFDGVSDGDTSEVAALADWAEMPPTLFHRHVRTLYGRGLIQHRDRWRKLLPQALAFRLAREALEVLPAGRLEVKLRTTPRLMRSFTRQLGHLNDWGPAKNLARAWLAPVNGMPRDIGACDAEQLIWFQNIAPVDPSGALDAIERVAMPRWPQFGILSDLCVALAYEDALFPRAALLLARWCAGPDGGQGLEKFRRLFQIRLSGTHARVATRLTVVQTLLDDTDGPGHRLGIEALGGMLRAGSLDRHSDYAFGARIRDSGLWPVEEQFDGWYAATLGWMAERAQGPLRGVLRERVASALPALCRQSGRPLIAQALVSCVSKLSTGSIWPDAWVAVSKALRRTEIKANIEPAKAEGTAVDQDARACIEDLESRLRPVRLADQVRAHAMTEPWELNYATAQPLSGDEFMAMDTKLDEQVCDLGRALAEQREELETLLPELILNTRPSRQALLGRGLSIGCLSGSQRKDLWDRMVDAFSTAEADRRDVGLLAGFLQGVAEQESKLAQDLLDAAITHPALSHHLPALQRAAAPIGSTGAQRLIRSAAEGLAPADAFGILESGDAISTIPGVDLFALLSALAEQDDGTCVAAALLYRRLVADKQRGDSDPLLLSFGRRILEKVCLTCERSAGYVSTELIRACLRPQGQADPAAHTVAQGIALAMRDQFTQRRGNDAMGHIIEALLHVQPTATLDVLFGFGDEQQATDYWEFFVADNAPPAWLDKVPDDVLLNWVSSNPLVRAPRIAAACRYLPAEGPGTEPAWTTLARSLIDECPARVEVVEQFVRRFVPAGSIGSRAAIVERRRALLAEFFNDPDPGVSIWARSRDSTLQTTIDNLREEEECRSRRRQRFED